MERSAELQHALDELHRLTGVRMDIRADSEEERMFAIRQAKALCSAYKEKYNANYFLLNLMTSAAQDYDIGERAMRLHIRSEQPRVLFLLDSKHGFEETVVEILKHLFPLQRKIYFIPVNANQLAVLYPLDEKAGVSDIEELACMMIDTLGAEALVRIQLSYSDIFQNLTGLSEAYRQAALALKVGKIFYAEQTIFPFDKLGAGRLIYRLPEDVCKAFLMEVIGDIDLEWMVSETLPALDKFFQNNLNIAETARQLHMHRNTLIYRLEQIEKRTGLDLRQFEDAMTFKIAMMVMNYLHSSERA